MTEQRAEHIKVLLEQHAAQRREFEMAAARRRGRRALLAELEKSLPADVPLHKRGFGVLEREGPMSRAEFLIRWLNCRVQFRGFRMVTEPAVTRLCQDCRWLGPLLIRGIDAQLARCLHPTSQRHELSCLIARSRTASGGRAGISAARSGDTGSRAIEANRSRRRSADRRVAGAARGRAGMSEHIGTTEVRQEGFYWVILGQNPPEIAYWERGEWWLAGEAKPWHPRR